MSKKLILFLMLALFGSTSFLRADVFEVQIGEGIGTTGYYPFYTLYNYSIAENIYLASEMQEAGMSAGTITSLSYYATNETGNAQQGLSLWMANVTDTELTTTSHITTDMTLVYTGSMTPAIGWNEFEFNENYFDWDGTSNVIVFCQRNNGTWNSTINWQATTGLSFNAMSYKYQDSGAYDVTVANTMNVSTSRPNVIMKGVTSGGGGGGWNPNPNVALETLELTAPENGAQNVGGPVALQFTIDENTVTYDLYFGTTYPPAIRLEDVEPTAANVSYLVGALDNNTRYFWKVVLKNNTGELASAINTFVTTMEPPTEVQAVDTEIFTDGSTLIKWRSNLGGVTDIPEIQIGTGTGEQAYFPTYNLYNYSYTQQIYSVEETEGNGFINSISFLPKGDKERDLDIYIVNTDKAAFASGADWIQVTADDLVYSGVVSFVANTWKTITFANPFLFDGEYFAIVVDDNTGSWDSSIKYATFDATAQGMNMYNDNTNYNPMSISGDGTVRNFKNQIIINKASKGVAENRSLTGFNLYANDVKMNTNLINQNKYLLSGLEYNMDGYSIKVTGVYDEGESGYSTEEVMVYVSGYGNKVTGTVTELVSGAPIAGATVQIVGTNEFGANVNYTATTDATGKYEIAGPMTGSYTRAVVRKDGMEPNFAPQFYLDNEEIEIVNFTMHEVYNPVYKVYAEDAYVLGHNVANVMWSMYDFANPSPTPGPGPGPQPGTGDTFSVNFDDSQIPTGWTMIDGGTPSGYGWQLASTKLGTGYGHNGSADCILSQSYDNNYGVVYPDNYFISPSVAITTGSTFSFWACGQDASYAAEHFGVAVSTTGTNASDFTMVNEWTMTAKGSGVMAPGRDGQTRAQGNWYQYSVDLSSYAGQNVYIAIRHFNCSDMFYLDVDDLALTIGTKGNRDVNFFTLYRKTLLQEGSNEPVVETMVGSMTDTLYTDYSWADAVPGLYQYGVSAVYPVVNTGRGADELTVFDGTTTNGYVPVYGFYADAYLKSEMIYPADALTDMVGGTIDGFKFYASQASVSWGAANFTVFVKEVDNTTASAFVGTDGATVVYQGSLSISGGEMTVNFNTPYIYNGGNLLVGFYNTATGSYVTSTWYGETVAGASLQGYSYTSLSAVSGTQRNFLPKTTFDYTAASGSNDNPVTETTWSNILPKDMETTINVNVTANAGPANGAVAVFESLTEDVVYELEFDEETSATIEEFRKGVYNITVTLEGYDVYEETEVSIWHAQDFDIELIETVAPVSSVYVSPTGLAMWTDMMANTDVPLSYFCTLNGIFIGEYTDHFMMLDDNDLEEGETYTFGVAVNYTTDLSEYVTCDFTYIGCAAVDPQVEGLAATNEIDDLNVLLTWNGATPTPGPGPGPQPGTGSTFEEGFESGMPTDWNVIDGNNDGWTWCLTSNIPSTWTYYASLTLDWYRTGTNAICSGSYINGVGALTPNEYLVTNELTLVSGSTFSFWAAATDAGYPADHFGVFVSDNGTSDWTMVNEWTLTGKKGADGGRASRDGEGAKLGTWYQYTVDLSSYAGQKYLAIRHFNCNDQYIMCVDDLSLSVATKGRTVLYEPHYVTDPAAMANGGDASWIKGSQSTYGPGAQFTTGNKVADDFTLDAATTITEIEVYGYQTGSSATSTFTGLYAVIYDGNPMNGGQIVWGDMNTNIMTSTSFTNAYRGSDGDNTGTTRPIMALTASNLNIQLEAGTYYLAWNMAGSGSSGPWAQPEAYPGTGNSGNGVQFLASNNAWANLADSGSGTAYGVAFKLVGEGGGPGPGPQPTGDIPVVPGKFNVLFDDEFYGTTADTQINILAPDFEEHVYTVFWVGEDYSISCPAIITYAALQDDATPENSIVKAIYPNPTNGDLNIKATAMTRISIVNAMGQMVYDKAVSGDETVVDMSQMEAGVYMVNIVTENGSSVQRVTDTK